MCVCVCMFTCVFTFKDCATAFFPFFSHMPLGIKACIIVTKAYHADDYNYGEIIMTIAMPVIESEAKNGGNKHTGPPVAVRSVSQT